MVGKEFKVDDEEGKFSVTVHIRCCLAMSFRFAPTKLRHKGGRHIRTVRTFDAAVLMCLYEESFLDFNYGVKDINACIVHLDILSALLTHHGSALMLNTRKIVKDYPSGGDSIDDEIHVLMILFYGTQQPQQQRQYLVGELKSKQKQTSSMGLTERNVKMLLNSAEQN
uniref:Uncharacterized protein n=1 Tax=Glossina austeni TaxID=7395 RepID=A0A1A9VKU4_GLOAU